MPLPWQGIGLRQNLMDLSGFAFLLQRHHSLVPCSYFNSFSTTTLPPMKCDNAFNTEFGAGGPRPSTRARRTEQQPGQPRLLLVICCMIVFTCLYFSLWRE
uniref:Uncharacterized protein n=1 Tax=Macrostomum lignano TaxID=282301 RepID=A0A1I8FN01_9PLAT